ncbi:MAG: hypothetical protein RR406_04875 [Bacilli bacterium]
MDGKSSALYYYISRDNIIDSCCSAESSSVFLVIKTDIYRSLSSRINRNNKYREKTYDVSEELKEALKNLKEVKNK